MILIINLVCITNIKQCKIVDLIIKNKKSRQVFIYRAKIGFDKSATFEKEIQKLRYSFEKRDYFGFLRPCFGGPGLGLTSPSEELLRFLMDRFTGTPSKPNFSLRIFTIKREYEK